MFVNGTELLMKATAAEARADCRHWFDFVSNPMWQVPATDGDSFASAKARVTMTGTNSFYKPLILGLAIQAGAVRDGLEAALGISAKRWGEVMGDPILKAVGCTREVYDQKIAPRLKLLPPRPQDNVVLEKAPTAELAQG